MTDNAKYRTLVGLGVPHDFAVSLAGGGPKPNILGTGDADKTTYGGGAIVRRAYFDVTDNGSFTLAFSDGGSPILKPGTHADSGQVGLIAEKNYLANVTAQPGMYVETEGPTGTGYVEWRLETGDGSTVHRYFANAATGSPIAPDQETTTKALIALGKGDALVAKMDVSGLTFGADAVLKLEFAVTVYPLVSGS